MFRNIENSSSFYCIYLPLLRYEDRSTRFRYCPSKVDVRDPHAGYHQCHAFTSLPEFSKQFFNDPFSCNMTQNDGAQKQVCLKKASDVKIERHVKILGTANPFDAQHEEYFEKRTALKMAGRLSGRRKLLAIWQRQKGRCPICCEKITTETGWNLHHIVQRVDGVSDDSSNLCLLYPVCHRQGHCSGFTFVLPVGPDNPTSRDSSRVP
jgi:hypothetical protein